MQRQQSGVGRMGGGGSRRAWWASVCVASPIRTNANNHSQTCRFTREPSRTARSPSVVVILYMISIYTYILLLTLERRLLYFQLFTVFTQ